MANWNMRPSQLDFKTNILKGFAYLKREEYTTWIDWECRFFLNAEGNHWDSVLKGFFSSKDNETGEVKTIELDEWNEGVVPDRVKEHIRVDMRNALDYLDTHQGGK